MNIKKIVVLGAGYGGILTAKKLAKKFKKDKDVQITVIDQKPYHTMLTELHEVAANRVPEDAIKIDLAKVFAKRNVEVKLDYIQNINFDAKTLQGDQEEYSYDYLVLGTGSKPAFFGCKGAEEHALTLWSYEDAVQIKEHILSMFRGAVVEKNVQKRAKMLTFVVVGCGFTGIEMIGELGEWKKTLCKEFNVPEEEVKLYAIDMLPKILPMFDDQLIAKSEKRLKKLGIEVMLGSSITEVNKEHVCINGRGCIDTNTIIWTAGIEGSTIMEKATLDKNGRNRIECNEYLQAKQYKDVYVVGDNIFFIPEGQTKPVPQMVENAEHSAGTVSNNIFCSIKEKELAKYEPEFHGAMVCIGGRYGVAQVGTSKKDFHFSGFIAMFIKHFINVIYFLQVAGFNKIWTYLMHEFFHVPDRRSFVGGYLSKRSPNFWLVPLRMFIGAKWLFEGLNKIQKVITDPSNIFLIPAPVDGNSSATWVEGGTEVAEYAAEVMVVPEFIKSLVDSSMEFMFYNGEGGYTVLASVFQTAMVIGEIAVGLCLIGGLFSAIASIVSIAMSIMIWSSGMATTEMLWYMIAPIALIGGSGSTFGLDYYVLPFLKKRWKKIGFVKKWYIYTE